MITAKRKRRLNLDGQDNLQPIKADFKLFNKKNKNLKWINSTDIGFSIAIPIAGGVLVGGYLDHKFDTTPKLSLSFLFLGVIIGFINIVKVIKESQEK